MVFWRIVGRLDDEVDEDDEDVEEDNDVGEDESDALEEANERNVVFLLLEIIAFAVSYGAVVGTAVAVMPWARWTACIGGGVWGLLMAFANVTSAQKDMPIIVPRFRKGLGGILGLITGTIQGAFVGIMAVAFVGALVGGIVGVLFQRLLGGTNGRFFHIFPGLTMFAAACGVAAQAFYLNRAEATNGLCYGAVIGLGSGVFLCVAALPLAFLTVRKPLW